MTAYIMCFLLFCIGIYCILRKRNIIKMIIGIILAEYAVNLFFVLLSYRTEGRSPIFSPNTEITSMVDALPQAVVHSSIMIGLATTVLLIGIAMRLYEHYRTFDITKIKDLNG